MPPHIAGADEPQDFTVSRNRQVTLECKSDAVPPPVIMWLKNGEHVQVNLFPEPHRLILEIVTLTQIKTSSEAFSGRHQLHSVPMGTASISQAHLLSFCAGGVRSKGRNLG